MRKTLARRVIWPLAVLLGGFGLLGSTGCDKTTETTIQNGVISASGALLQSVLQAAVTGALNQANGS